jgi:hypothetical protein
VCGGQTTVTTTRDYNSAIYPGSNLLNDSCTVSGAPATYWVGSNGPNGHTIVLTLPCTVTIDRHAAKRSSNLDKGNVSPYIWDEPKIVSLDKVYI